MLSVTKAYEDFRLIRVLVVPLGINSQFEDQYRILSRLESIPLYDLNKPLYSKGYNPPFKYLDWLKGELCFDFLRYDQAPSGPTDFEDFQSSKRIVIIMGVLNYPDFISHSEKLEVELDRFAKRYPNILLKKIMVFNYNFDSSSSLRMQASPGLLEIFPPDGDCEGGSMLDVHFRQVMAQTSVQLVQAFEQQMDHCEDARLRGIFPTNPCLTTGFDDKEEMRGGSSKTSKVFRKRPTGRVHKWMGDLSLQVCSPLDAVEHYVAAINESRSQGDTLWLAGALDGYASAILILQELQFDLEDAIGKDLRTVTQPASWNPDDEDDYYEEDNDNNENGDGKGKNYVPEVFLLAEERATEALNFYASHVAFKNMELESCFRLAKLYEARMLKHPRRLQKLSEYVMRGVAIPGLSARQQLDAVLEAALVCRRAGLFRKQTKLLYIAALMAADQGNYAIASVLMEHVSEHFGVSVSSLSANGDEEPEDGSGSSGDRGTVEEKDSRDLRNGWLNLSISVLTDAAAIAQEAQSPQFTAQVLCRLLALQSTKELEHATVRSFLSQYNRKTLGLEKFVRKKAPRNFPLASSGGALNEAAVAALQQSDHIGSNVNFSVVNNNNNNGVDNSNPPTASTSGMLSATHLQAAANLASGSVAGSNSSYPPRPPNTTGAPSLVPPSLTSNSCQRSNHSNHNTMSGSQQGQHSPMAGGHMSDRRSVSTVMTTSTFRTATNMRQLSFNPLSSSASTYNDNSSNQMYVSDSSSVASSTIAINNNNGNNNAAGGASNGATGTEAFLASLRSLSVPKLQLGTSLSGGSVDNNLASNNNSSNNNSGNNNSITSATPRSPDFRQLTRATQAQVASGASGRTLSGTHSNSVSQRLLRSLAGDLLALDSVSASNFNLFDNNFGLTSSLTTSASALANHSDSHYHHSHLQLAHHHPLSSANNSNSNASALTASLAASASAGAGSNSNSNTNNLAGSGPNSNNGMVSLSNNSNALAASSNSSLVGAAGSGAASFGAAGSVSLPDTALFHLVDISLARDILHYVTSRLVPQHVSLEVQEAVWSNLLDAAACLARPARSVSLITNNNSLSIFNSSKLGQQQQRIQLPVTLLALRPQRPWDNVNRQFTGSAWLSHSTPMSLVANMRSLLAQTQERLLAAQQASQLQQKAAEDGSAVADDANKSETNGAAGTTSASTSTAAASSAFFYDPFAARRQQQQKAAAQALEEVTWCWSSDLQHHPLPPQLHSPLLAGCPSGHNLVATLANPLSVAVSVRLVCVLRVSVTNDASANGNNEDGEGKHATVTGYPIEVEIPPRTLAFDVYIPLKLDALLSPLISESGGGSGGLRDGQMVSLRLQGVRMVLGGLSEFVTVDNKGAADLSGRAYALQRLVQRQQLQQQSYKSIAAPWATGVNSTTYNSNSTNSSSNNNQTKKHSSALSSGSSPVATSSTSSAATPTNTLVPLQRSTARTNEVTVVVAPCTAQLYSAVVHPIGNSNSSTSVDASSVVAGEAVSEAVSIQLFPGETRTSRFLLQCVRTTGTQQRQQQLEEKECARFDVRVRLMQRSSSLSSSSSTCNNNSNSQTPSVLHDFVLLAAVNTTTTSSANKSSNSSNGLPVISVTISEHVVYSNSHHPRHEPQNVCWFSVEVTVSDVWSHNHYYPHSSTQTDHFDLLFDVAPLAEKQWQTLQLLRNNKSSLPDKPESVVSPVDLQSDAAAVRLLEAVLTPEAVKQWQRLPLRQQTISLRIQRIPYTQSVSWTHPRPQVAALTETQQQRLSRALYERLSPLRVQRIGTNHNTINNAADAVVTMNSPQISNDHVPPSAANSTTSYLQPHHLRVKLLKNNNATNTNSSNSSSSGNNATTKVFWQSTVSNLCPYPVHLTLLPADPATLQDHTSNSDEDKSDGNADGKTWTIAAHSAIQVSFQAEKHVRAVRAQSESSTNTTNASSGSERSVWLRWSFWDSVEHRKREGVLVLHLPFIRSMDNNTNSSSTNSANTNTVTKSTQPLTITTTAANKTPTGNSNKARSSGSYQLTADWLQLEVFAALTSSSPPASAAVAQPVRLSFSSAHSLLTPVFRPLELRCCFHHRCFNMNVEAVEVVVLVEEEYAALFPPQSTFSTAAPIGAITDINNSSNNDSQRPSAVSTVDIMTSDHQQHHHHQNPNYSNNHNTINSNMVSLSTIPAGVLISGKLRALCPLQRESLQGVSAVSGTGSADTNFDNTFGNSGGQYSIRVCFARHGLFTFRFLVRPVTAPAAAETGEKQETWWTTRHAVTIRVCLDE